MYPSPNSARDDPPIGGWRGYFDSCAQELVFIASSSACGSSAAVGEWTVGKTPLFPPPERGETGLTFLSRLADRLTFGGLFAFTSVL